MAQLRSARQFDRPAAEGRRLQREGHRLYRLALAELFTQRREPLEVVAWKDVFQRLQAAMDATKAAAEALTAIRLQS